MSQRHVRNVWEDLVARLKQRAARSKDSRFPDRRPGRRLLEALQAGPFAEPDFEPERARDRGRRIEL